MQMQKVKIAVSLAVILGALGFLAAWLFLPRPKFEELPHIGMGETLASLAAKQLGNGGRIILIAPDASHLHPGTETQLQSLLRALRRANLAVAATNIIKRDPLRVVEVPSGDFANILQKRTENDVVISLLGPPNLTPEQKTRVPARRPKVIAVCAGNIPRRVNLRALFTENFLHAAIVSRETPPAGRPDSKEPRPWFDHFYRVVTAGNVAEIPRIAEAHP
jgi:hypothetical protein